MQLFEHVLSILWSPPGHTRCSWQETKVWNPGATPKPSWSMKGGSSWVWIWTLIPASNDVSSVDSKRLGRLQLGRWFVCTHWPYTILPKAVAMDQMELKLCRVGICLSLGEEKQTGNQKGQKILFQLEETSFEVWLLIHQNPNDIIRHDFSWMTNSLWSFGSWYYLEWGVKGYIID